MLTKYEVTLWSKWSFVADFITDFTADFITKFNLVDFMEVKDHQVQVFHIKMKDQCKPMTNVLSWNTTLYTVILKAKAGNLSDYSVSHLKLIKNFKSLNNFKS